MSDTHLRLGEVLIEAGVLNSESLKTVLALQKKRQLRLGTILLQEEFVTEPQLVQALSRRLSIPWVSLYHIDIPDELLDLVPASVAEEFFLIPIYIRTTGSGEKALYVAMNDPTDDSALRFVSASAGMTVKPMIAGPSDISAAIRFYYYGEEEPSEIPAPGISTYSSVPPAPPLPPPSSSLPRDGSVPPPPPPAITPNEDVRADAPSIPDEEPEQLQTEDLVTIPPEEEPEPEVTDSIPVADDATVAALESEGNDKQRAQRDVEKHMFGVGGGKARGGIALTLLDGTTIAFGGAAQQNAPSDQFTKEDLIAGLRAAANGTPMEDFLPSDRWEDYMATLLEILFNKHLVFFDEFMEAIKKKKS